MTTPAAWSRSTSRRHGFAMLDDSYIQEAEYRARRFSGAYTGTSGSLAADTLRLINERKRLMERIAELEQSLDACHAETERSIPADWILRGERALRASQEPRPLGAGVLAPAGENESERLLHDALDAVRDRRTKYGPPTDHFAITTALVNATFGTHFTPGDWAVVMMLDKIARSRGPANTRDNWVDLAGYAACRAETDAPQPPASESK